MFGEVVVVAGTVSRDAPIVKFWADVENNNLADGRCQCFFFLLFISFLVPQKHY